MIYSGLVGRTVFLIQHIIRHGGVLQGETMLYSGTEPESYFTEETSVYED